MKFDFKFLKTKEKRIHLDYASTTPIHKDVYDAMRLYFEEKWANAGAIYKEGVEIKKAIEDAREKLARTLRVRASDVTYTSGGTESNNLALVGLVEKLFDTGRSYDDMEIITTRIEHPSILDTLAYLEKKGVRITYAPIDTEGRIDLPAFGSLLNEKTILVTCAYVNSEIGVVQDIKKLSRGVRIFNEKNALKILVHSDASQAPLWLPCALDGLGLDMMTLDAGKCYGPKGAGVLVHRHNVELKEIMFGGGQEAGLRSGTENTPLIIGCVEALVRAQQSYESKCMRATELRDTFFKYIESEIPEAIVNGSREFRVANNINISIPKLDTEYAVIWLDKKGIAVSTKSACGASESTGSRVVREMTHDDTRANSTLRFTLGEESSLSDIKMTIRVLKEFIERMR